MEDDNSIRVTDTVYYTMIQIARYLKIVGKKSLEKDLTGLTFEEYGALDLIYCTPDLCQNDLANFLVFDKGRICKLVESLEIKGFIERTASIRNKKLIKILNITQKGKMILVKNKAFAQKLMESVESKLSKSEIKALDKSLKILLKSMIEISERN